MNCFQQFTFIFSVATVVAEKKEFSDKFMQNGEVFFTVIGVD